ncbi:hypothetical protein N0V82_001091 [Gnomoniopsis sp. IMI 355080]|nr:hypothetical protein N0V82_001091 [Gnomoniopsis sp. IMI 355080]
MSRHTSQRPYAPRSQINWQQGDVAFLRHYDTFSREDYANLIASGYLAKGATVHPAIILAVFHGKAIVTTISAYSTEESNLIAPWEQKWHRSKSRDHFWAFEGTARPNNKHPALRLADPNMKMPKPKASWVYAQHFFCVPFSVLGWFNKSPTLLRVHPESIRQLTLDMRVNFPQWYNDAGARLHGSITTGAATIGGAPHTPRLSLPSAPAFPQFTRWSGAIRPQHMMARTPGIRVAS